MRQLADAGGGPTRSALLRGAVPRLAAFVALALVLYLLPLVLGYQWVAAGTVAGFYALTAIGLDILWGLAGQVSLGQGAFMAVGSYGTALVAVHLGLPAWLGDLVGLAVAFAMAIVLGVLVLRLDSIYLAIGTMGFALVVPALILALPDITGGGIGVFGVPALNVAGLNLTDSNNMYIFVWALALALVYGALRLAESRVGLSWRLLGEHQMVADAVGVRSERRKMQALVLSAVLGSVSGSLYAQYTQTVSSVSFGFPLLLVLVFIVILGGLGTGYGALVGAIVVGLITMVSGSTGRYTTLVYGVILLGVLYAAPQGVVGIFRDLSKRLWSRSGPRSAELAPQTAASGGEILAGLDRIAGVLGVPRQSSAEGLQLLEVSKSFGGVVANADVTFDVRPGEVLGVIGPNGAGKSTIVNIATGIYSADEGAVVWNGADISAWPSSARAAAGIARTFQQPSIVPDVSVVDNVAIGAYRFGKRGIGTAVFSPAGRRELERLRQAARLALGIVGLQSLESMDSKRLSFGQRRLVELARAILLLPTVIFLDEPLSGLDADEREQIVDLLRGLREAGVAVCLIEHDTQTMAALADRICVLDFGRVLCIGSPEEVFADPRVRASYMGETVGI